MNIHIKKYRFFTVDTCDSTMDLCRDLMKKTLLEEDKGCVVLAERQRKGRGRRGKGWKSESGNLYTSIGLRLSDNFKNKTVSQLSFVVAIALGKTILNYAKDLDLSYKWPNDLFIEGKKLGGVLIEIIDNYVIVGVGINIKHSPSLKDYETTSLKDYGVDITPKYFLEDFVNNFDVYKKLWIQKGFSSIQSKWVERAWKLNELAFVKNSKGQIIEGIFKGINSKGGLIIQQAENEEVLYSAQIIR
jgi:BirA family biotin operon repressor/biotin-[acetyl-CoA-carboxylase] ligase